MGGSVYSVTNYTLRQQTHVHDTHEYIIHVSRRLITTCQLFATVQWTLALVSAKPKLLENQTFLLEETVNDDLKHGHNMVEAGDGCNISWHDTICCNFQESESIEFLGPIPLENT